MSDRIDLWVEYLVKEKGLLPNSIKLYRRTIEIAERDLGPLEDLDTQTIRTWLHAKGGSASSFTNRLSALRSFYRWQVKAGLREVDPTLGIEAPRRRKGLPKPVEDIETKMAFLDAYDALWDTIPDGQSRAMMTVLLETGLRIHEAVKLDVPVPAPTQLRVIGKGAKDAMIPLTDKAREALDFLGGRWPIGARATQRRFERAGFHPHMCRHWRGTSMAESGADLGDIQAMLRHSSPATTLGYAAWSVDRVRNALARVG